MKLKRKQIIVSLEGMKIINNLSQHERFIIDEAIEMLKKDKNKLKKEKKYE